MLRTVRSAGSVASTIALIAFSALPAHAAQPEYAAWTFDGSGGAYTGTMSLPGVPTATLTSDSRANAGLQTGANTWLGPNTPFGQVYGSSQDQQYLNLRPAADNPTSPSTTTYTFASPTPVGTWGFALGDLDADDAVVSATDANGNPVPVDALGFQQVFNFCDTSPRAGTCSSETPPYDVPTWIPGSDSGKLAGHPGAQDTIGAAGWFQPTVPLSTLTIVFYARSGAPVYQTWFASSGDIPTPTPTPVTSGPVVMPVDNAKPGLAATGPTIAGVAATAIGILITGIAAVLAARRRTNKA